MSLSVYSAYVKKEKFQVRMYISDKTSDNTQMSSSHVTRWGTNKAAQSIVIRDNVHTVLNVTIEVRFHLLSIFLEPVVQFG